MIGMVEMANNLKWMDVWGKRVVIMVNFEDEGSDVAAGGSGDVCDVGEEWLESGKEEESLPAAATSKELGLLLGTEIL